MRQKRQAAPTRSRGNWDPDGESTHLEVLQRTIAAMLGVAAADIAVDRPVRTLGVNSIHAVALTYALEQLVGAAVPVEIFARGDRSIAEIARSAAALADDESQVDADRWPVIIERPADRFAAFPLSDIQESFLVGRLLADRAPVGAHIYFEIDTAEVLDLYALRKALERLVERHDILRTRFTADHQQAIRPSIRIPLVVIDLRRLSDVDRAARATTIRNALERKVYAIDSDAFFEVRVALHPDKTVIHFSIDELLVDGMSVQTLLHEWAVLYRCPDAPPPPIALSFRDYVLATKAFQGSARYRSDLEYWMDALSGLAGGPSLPWRPSADGDIPTSRLTGSLERHGWAVLKGTAQALDVSPTVLLLSIFAEVLRVDSTTDSFALVLTFFNRPPLHADIDRLVGPLISTTVHRVEPRLGDFTDCIRAHQAQLWRELDHSYVSGITALRELKAARKVPPPTILPVVFTSMLNVPAPPALPPPLGHVTYQVNQTPQVFLDHQVREEDGALHFSWDVADSRFEPGVPAALFANYCRVLERFAHGAPLEFSAFSATAGPPDAGAQQATAPAFVVEADPSPQEPFPLTDQQHAYAFGRSAHVADPNSCQWYQELDLARSDAARLQTAWAAVVHRHPMLRALVGSDGTQRVLDEAPPYAIATTDLSTLDQRQRDAALTDIRDAMMARIAPLDDYPFFELRISIVDASTARLHACIDLIVADCGSIAAILGELVATCRDAAPSPAPSITFRAYQLAAQRHKRSAAHDASIRYWSNKFASLPVGPALPNGPDERRHRRLEARLADWETFQARSRAIEVAPAAVLLAVYLEVLYEWSGRRPLTVAVPSWKRLPVHVDIDRVVGDFTAMCWVPHRGECLSIADRARLVHGELERDLAQRPVSGLSVLRRVALRDRSKRLVFPAVFTDHGPQIELAPGFTLGRALSKTPHVALDNISIQAGGALFCAWDSAGVYDRQLVDAMFADYMRVLDGLCDGADGWSRVGIATRSSAAPNYSYVAEAGSISFGQ